MTKKLVVLISITSLFLWNTICLGQTMQDIQFIGKINKFNYDAQKEVILVGKKVVLKVKMDETTNDRLYKENLNKTLSSDNSFVSFLQSPNCPNNPESILWVSYLEQNIYILSLNENIMEFYGDFLQKSVNNFVYSKKDIESNKHITRIGICSSSPSETESFFSDDRLYDVKTNFLIQGEGCISHPNVNELYVHLYHDENDKNHVVEFIDELRNINLKRTESSNHRSISFSDIYRNELIKSKLTKVGLNGWEMTNKNYTIIYSPEINNEKPIIIKSELLNEFLFSSKNIYGSNFIQNIFKKAKVDQASGYDKSLGKKGVSKNNILIELANKTEL